MMKTAIILALAALMVAFMVGLSRRFEETSLEISQLARRFEETSRETSRRFDETSRRFDLLDDSISELVAATLTPRSAARVEACARGSSAHLTFTNNSGSKIICSAFAYRPQFTKSYTMVSAAHCFANVSPTADITLQRLDDPAVYTCRVAALFGLPEDSAILSCPHLDGLEEAAVSPSSAKLGQIIAITGFAHDVFTGTPRHIAGAAVALNVDFSHAVGVIGPGPSHMCSQSHGGAPYPPPTTRGLLEPPWVPWPQWGRGA